MNEKTMTEEKQVQETGVQTAVDLGIYTPLSVAKEEIWRRWNDKELKKKVEDFLGGDVPEVFRKEPRSALFRFIATPNLEYVLASEMAKLMDLELVFMEFLGDKFCTRNQDKLYLGKLAFFYQKDGRVYLKQKKKIIDIERCDNKPLREIKTFWGESFIDFHHRIFDEKYGKTQRFNVSDFKTNGESSYEVYLKVFALFICHGILFENYFIMSNKDEKKFTLNVIKPAFDEIHRIFGIKPLVVPLISSVVEETLYWQYYPDYIMDKILNTK